MSADWNIKKTVPSWSKRSCSLYGDIRIINWHWLGSQDLVMKKCNSCYGNLILRDAPLNSWVMFPSLICRIFTMEHLVLFFPVCMKVLVFRSYRLWPAVCRCSVRVLLLCRKSDCTVLCILIPK